MLIENSFTVAAPLEEAWRVLTDVPRLVPAMPGVELTETLDARHFKGRVLVKIGPVALVFAGEAALDELDPSAYRARVKAKGSETKGRGGAQAELVFELHPAGDGTRVDFRTDLQLTGAVAQYGRAQGLIKEIASQLTGEFAENLKKEMKQTTMTVPAADTMARAAHPEAAAISGLGLFLRALKALVARFLARLFSSSEERKP